MRSADLTNCVCGSYIYLGGQYWPVRRVSSPPVSVRGNSTAATWPPMSYGHAEVRPSEPAQVLAASVDGQLFIRRQKHVGKDHV